MRLRKKKVLWIHSCSLLLRTLFLVVLVGLSVEASTADNLRNGRTNVYYGVHTNTLSLELYLVLLDGLPFKQCCVG